MKKFRNTIISNKLGRGIARLVKQILVAVFSAEAFVARCFAKHAYKNLFVAEWFIIDVPENFNHMIDLYYGWGQTGISHWLERGG